MSFGNNYLHFFSGMGIGPRFHSINYRHTDNYSAVLCMLNWIREAVF